MPHGSGAVGIAGAGERVAADENLTAAERQWALHEEQGLEAFETAGKEGVLEKALLAFKRAGADGVLTYFALDAARLLKKARS